MDNLLFPRGNRCFEQVTVHVHHRAVEQLHVVGACISQLRIDRLIITLPQRSRNSERTYRKS